ncbi:MAG: LysR family transcriptional regulator [Oscillospiraceae bacterium]|nr:LysR family transcriptional regulator [Oscillospiraceae bacterium]
MNTDVLKYCLDIAEYLSFTKVAEKNYITQQALSQQIINLENSIGVRLFDRSNRSVSLTPAGKVFLEEAKKCLERIDTAILKAQMFSSGYEGLLSLGCNGPFSHGRFTRIIKEFSKRHPNIGINFKHASYTTIVSEFKSNSFDLIATGCFEDFDDRVYNVQKLNSGRVNAVVSREHPFAARASITLDELFSEPYICLALMGSNAAHIRRMDRLKGLFGGQLPPNIRFAYDSDTVALFVESGIGFTILQDSLKGAYKPRTLEFLDIEGVETPIETVRVWKKDNSNPALPLLLEVIEDLEGADA